MADETKTALAKRALLAKLSTGGWRGAAVDEDVSEDVRKRAGAQEGHGRYVKRLLNREATKECEGIRREAQILHQTVTLPWQDTWRLLPVTGYKSYQAAIAVLEERQIVARAKLASSLEGWKQEARERLGDLYDEDEYPSASDLASRFFIEAQFGQVPDVKHFIADVNEAERAEIERNISEQIEARIKGAVSDLYQRLDGLLSWVAESLEKGKFGTLMWTRISEVCDLLPRLNITNDEHLASMVERLRTAFSGISDPKELRPKEKAFDPEKKTEVVDALAELRERMGGYGTAEALPGTVEEVTA